MCANEDNARYILRTWCTHIQTFSYPIGSSAGVVGLCSTFSHKWDLCVLKYWILPLMCTTGIWQIQLNSVVIYVCLQEMYFAFNIFNRNLKKDGVIFSIVIQRVNLVHWSSTIFVSWPQHINKCDWQPMRLATPTTNPVSNQYPILELA